MGQGRPHSRRAGWYLQPVQPPGRCPLPSMLFLPLPAAVLIHACPACRAMIFSGLPAHRAAPSDRCWGWLRSLRPGSAAGAIGAGVQDNQHPRDDAGAPGGPGLEGDPVLERERLRRYALGLLALDDVLTVSIDGLDGQTAGARTAQQQSAPRRSNAGEPPESPRSLRGAGARGAGLQPDAGHQPRAGLPAGAARCASSCRARRFARCAAALLIDTLGLLGSGAVRAAGFEPRFGAILTPFERVQRLLNRLRNSQFEPPLHRGDDGGPARCTLEGIGAIARLPRAAPVSDVAREQTQPNCTRRWRNSGSERRARHRPQEALAASQVKSNSSPTQATDPRR